MFPRCWEKRSLRCSCRARCARRPHQSGIHVNGHARWRACGRVGAAHQPCGTMPPLGGPYLHATPPPPHCIYAPPSHRHPTLTPPHPGRIQVLDLKRASKEGRELWLFRIPADLDVATLNKMEVPLAPGQTQLTVDPHPPALEAGNPGANGWFL